MRFIFFLLKYVQLLQCYLLKIPPLNSFCTLIKNHLLSWPLLIPPWLGGGTAPKCFLQGFQQQCWVAWLLLSCGKSPDSTRPPLTPSSRGGWRLLASWPGVRMGVGMRGCGEGSLDSPMGFCLRGSRLFCGYCLNVGCLAKLSLCWGYWKGGQAFLGGSFFCLCH